MRETSDLIEDAARLLSYGLRPRLRPSHEPEYAELLQRYRSESALREHVTLVARGLRLVVLGDWGSGQPEQWEVAQACNRTAEELGEELPPLAVEAGENVA